MHYGLLISSFPMTGGTITKLSSGSDLLATLRSLLASTDSSANLLGAFRIGGGLDQAEDLLMVLGIFTEIAIPISRAFFTIFTFSPKRERSYVIMTVTVILTIRGGFLFAGSFEAGVLYDTFTWVLLHFAWARQTSR
ncbi:MAG: DUF1634 domain-containing protein [Thermoplasmataceae archaeon]